MTPFGLDATGLVVWGLVAHCVGDWLLQSDWMAKNKALRNTRWDVAREMQGGSPRLIPAAWWDRHPAAWAHAWVHGLLLIPVFGFFAPVVALAHMVIDCRWLVDWFSRRVIKQTAPFPARVVEAYAAEPDQRPYTFDFDSDKIRTRWYDARGREVDERGVPVPKADLVERKLESLRSDMSEWSVDVMTTGSTVRLAVDQAWHVASIAVAALVVSL